MYEKLYEIALKSFVAYNKPSEKLYLKKFVNDEEIKLYMCLLGVIGVLFFNHRGILIIEENRQNIVV